MDTNSLSTLIAVATFAVGITGWAVTTFVSLKLAQMEKAIAKSFDDKVTALHEKYILLSERVLRLEIMERDRDREVGL